MLKLLRRIILLFIVFGWVLTTRDLLFSGNINYWMQWVLLVAAFIQSVPWIIERWRK